MQIRDLSRVLHKETILTDLAQKIDALFVLRRLPEMCDSAGISWESAFVNSLKELQSDIYQLDKYLESSWELDDDILQHHWQIIFRRLERMNVDSAYSSGNLEEISLYEKREKDMRLGIYPNPGDLPDLYYIKSCDVHLLRRLINQKSQGESHYCPENAWVLFDLVTEILDDLEDIGEDCETYNANTLLV